MGIIIDDNTRAIVQGITGKQGNLHAKLMLEYGTKIVAGVTPGKGQTEIHGVPVYDTVEEATEKHSPNASIIFVPASSALDAALEAIDNQIKTVVIITEHVPIKDSVELMAQAARKNAIIIGPNTPGVITPSKCKLGIMPSQIFKPGTVGIVSRSGTLTYEIAARLTKQQLGQSTCLGVGGDPVTGLNFIDALEMFEADSSNKSRRPHRRDRRQKRRISSRIRCERELSEANCGLHSRSYCTSGKTHGTCRRNNNGQYWDSQKQN